MKFFTKPRVRRMARAFIAGGNRNMRRAVVATILNDLGGGAKNISALKPWNYERVGRMIQIEADDLGTDLTKTTKARR